MSDLTCAGLMTRYPAHGLDELKRLCNEYKRQGRRGNTRGGHMPEVEEQHAQIQENRHAYRRGGHTAKTGPAPSIAPASPLVTASARSTVQVQGQTQVQGHGYDHAEPSGAAPGAQRAGTGGARASAQCANLAGCYRIRNKSTRELLYTDTRMLDPSRRRVLTWTGNPNQDTAMVWELLPMERQSVPQGQSRDAGAVQGSRQLYRIRNCKADEQLYVGSSLLDASRRHALTWTGQPHQDPAMAWELLPVQPVEYARTHERKKGRGVDTDAVTAANSNAYRIRNVSTGEFLYTGSNMLDANRRHALTWVGNPNKDPAMVWELQGWDVDTAAPRPLNRAPGALAGGGTNADVGNCVVCLANATTHVCVPCGHKCYCSDCAPRMEGKPCAICRQQVTSVMRVYE